MFGTTLIFVFLLAAATVDCSESRQRWNYKNISLKNTTSIFGRPIPTSDYCSKTPPTLQTDFNSNCSNINLPNCEDAWNGFSGAFRGKEPYKVDASDYQPYFTALPVRADQNQSLFWSGTFPIVEAVSTPPPAPIVVSSANTPSGVILNGMGNINWCGNISGIDYTNNCLCNVTTQFWVQFSAVFARAAKGSSYFLGDGERQGGIFSNSSFFSTVELPNMTAGVVKEVVVLAVHRQGRGESCSDTTGNSTIITLRNRIRARNFLYDCYDIYGQATNSSQTQTLAGCVNDIVRGIQAGMRPPNHQVNCVQSTNGATTTTTSVVSLLSVMMITIASLIVI